MYNSRLQSLENRRNLRTAFLLGIGSISLFIILIMFGMPALTRLAILLSNLRSSTQQIDKTDIIPPAPPQIIRSYEATNSAKQALSGYAEAGSTVYLTQNGQNKGNLVVSDDGKFHFDVNLETGVNIFQASVVDQAGNKSFASPEYILNYSNKSPKLSLELPSDGQIVSPKISIKGTVENATRLTVNDRILIITNNKFETILEIPEGENTLNFVAVDQFGNQTKRQLTVIAKS